MLGNLWIKVGFLMFSYLAVSKKDLTKMELNNKEYYLLKRGVI